MKNRVIALGFFDGVHLGHGGLLREARLRADECSATASVLTFDRHPSTVIAGTPTPLLSSQQDREYLMKTLYGMDEVLFIHFDRAMMEMPWEEFLDTCLLQGLSVCHIVCGEDYHFGYHGQGTAALLRNACAARGIGFDEIPEISVGGTPVHSTLIRSLLLDGRMEEAAEFLGHPHCLSGRVVSGKRLGRTIGVPTANIPVPAGVQPPPCGVYATMVEVDGHPYPAVTNVGNCPTISDGAPLVVEPWLLDFTGDLYGQEIRVFFHKKLRDETKFPSLAALQAEILHNAAQTRAYFQR